MINTDVANRIEKFLYDLNAVVTKHDLYIDRQDGICNLCIKDMNTKESIASLCRPVKAKNLYDAYIELHIKGFDR